MKLLPLAVLAAGLALASDTAHAATVAVRGQTLVISGGRAADKLVLRAGPRRLVVGGRAVARRRFARVVVRAGGGDDRVRVSGAVKRLTVDGGSGADTLVGGRRAERLTGGDGPDVVDGNGGDDTAHLGAGDDRYTWDAGDDVVDGGTGRDALTAAGTRAADAFRVAVDGVHAARRSARTLALERIDLRTRAGADAVTTDDLFGTGLSAVIADLGGADGAGDRAVVNASNGDDAVEVAGAAGRATVAGLAVPVTVTGEAGRDRLQVEALAGFDRLASGGLDPTSLALTANGGPDDDALAGGPAAETLLGGDGADAVDGNGGGDRALLGAGDDRFTWDAGDGSDSVEGQEGADTLAFNGSGDAERFAAAAAGARVRLTRDVGGVAMDLDDVERIDAAAAGGGDTLTTGDLSATDLTALRFATGTDGAGDDVLVGGSNGPDAFAVSGSPGATAVTRAGMRIEVIGARAPDDELHVLAFEGDDSVDAGALGAEALRLTVRAGGGADAVRGGRGPDLIVADAGNDTVDGNEGEDAASLGDGDDRFAWHHGDGSDSVDGGAGVDALGFTASGTAEGFDVVADGASVRFLRDLGDVAMRLTGLERIAAATLAGADRLLVGDLSGTPVTAVDVALGGADGAADTVNLHGTDGDDRATVTGAAGSATVAGLPATIAISGAEVPIDRVGIRLLAGDDAVDASALAADAIGFAADGGDGDDALTGGGGADQLRGGAGDDSLRGGPGPDDLDGGTGTNTVVED